MLPDFPRFFPIFPDFSRCFWPKKDGKTRGKSRFSPILSRKFEDSDLDPIPICWKVGIGHPDPIPICWKIGIGHPDLDLDPTRPDFCRDLIPLEISRTSLLEGHVALSGSTDIFWYSSNQISLTISWLSLHTPAMFLHISVRLYGSNALPS